MPTFPGTVTPAAWFDGNQQAYSDLAGLVPVSSGRIRRINEGSPMLGAWTAPTDNERPIRDSNSVRFECVGPAGGYRLTRPDPGGVYRDACTIVLAYVARDEHFAGPLMGGLQDSTQYAGFRNGSNQVFVNTSEGLYATGLLVAPGKLNVMSVTYTPSTVTVTLDADGVVTTASRATSPTHTLLGSWNLGLDGSTYLYGSVSQGVIVASALSTTDRDAVIAYAKAQPVPPAYPDDRVKIDWVGDSIPRATGATYGFAYPFLCLQAVRDAGYPAENCNVAVGGTGVNKLLDPINGALPPNANNLYLRAKAFYSPTRIKNVLVLALGTNNLAGDNSVSFILNGTGTPNDAGGTTPFPGSGLYPDIDDAIATGYDTVIVIVPGPRSDNPSFQATYNSRRAQVCNDLVANAASHGAPGRPVIVVDTRSIANFGADGDSDNTTYYNTDKIHPTTAGHALVAPAVTAAILAGLAATPAPPAPEPTVLSSVLTYDQTSWHRPGVDELGGGAQENLTPPRDPRMVPDVRSFNQLVRQIVADAKLAPSARIQVEFPGGVPTITAVAALNTTLVAGDFTITDNGNGDTSFTIAKYVGETLRPLELTVVSDVEIDRERIFPIANGWRVKTKLGATGTDAAFVVALHAPVQH
jgi:hypothetical protein